jgi:hypothetical protein
MRGDSRNPRLHRDMAIGLLVITGLAGTGCVRSTPPPDGRTLYVRYCASCHGLGGRGDGPVAGGLKSVPTDLTALARHGGFDEQRLLAVIDGVREVQIHGPREMPVWGAVFDEELEGAPHARYTTLLRARVLVDYLRTIQQP